MNLSEPTIKFLAKSICGDNGLMPRKKGPDLMDFFSEFGHDDRNRGDFTNRLKFAESKLKLANNTPALAKIIEGALQSREFFTSKIDREKSVGVINEQLRKDGFQLYKINDQYKLAHSDGLLVETRNRLSHIFIEDHIASCNTYIEDGRFNKAIKEAKDLLFSVMAALLEDLEGKEVEKEKKIEELYAEVKKGLKLNIVEPGRSPLGILQILSGFESILEGLSRLSYEPETAIMHPSPKLSWARLMVNSSKTMVEFLVDYYHGLR